MVRKPKCVWPGLVKMGFYQKQIAGDGNCLFASLSDQMYGTPNEHMTIRMSIINHMRCFRPLFEHYVHKDDVQQRRTLRSAVSAPRPESGDEYEEYLQLMSRPGTYGGEPELVAFTQVFDQDVTVHLPRIKDFNQDKIEYRNEHREVAVEVQPLHICYGGDEVTRAHYDSARNRDGSLPRPVEIPPLAATSTPPAASSPPTSSGPSSSAPPTAPQSLLTTRAIRGSRAEMSSEYLQDFLQKSKKDLDSSLDQLSDKSRARSPSVTSSQRSSSSKRSLDDDGEPIRANKRADRRKSMRRRVDMSVSYPDHDNEMSPPVPADSSNADTPSSTQSTDFSSDEPAQAQHSKTVTTIVIDDEDTEDEVRPIRRGKKVQPRITLNLAPKSTDTSSSPRLISVAQRPKSTLRA